VSPTPVPGFLRHLWLLWGLRLQIGLNRGTGKPSKVLAVATFLGSSAPALFFGLVAFGLMRLRPVAESNVWPYFILNLLCFVTTSVWVTWPLLSAGVDDHSELSRYAPFPISPFRLLISSSVASLFEPRALVFYAPLTGAALGYASVNHLRAPWIAVLNYVLFALLCAAWSRVALHAVINVLREKHSAEIIGGGLFAFLFAASFIPPVDTSWLTEVGEVGVSALNINIILNAAVALGRVPPGFFGDSLGQLAYGRLRFALFESAGLALFTALGLWVAYRLLLRFHRQMGRAGPSLKESGQDSNPFARTSTRFRTLVVREALDLWRNPRARLLTCVPFVLAILMKLLSGRDLFVYLLGSSADACLMGGLSVYGAVVISSTFSQNTFAYDGQGFAIFLAAPMELADVLRAKNLVQGAAGLSLALLVSLFYRVYFGFGSWVDLLCSLASVAAVVPMLLAAGNFLSLYFPVKFHANLKRRDKLPLMASMLGIVGASVGCMPFGWAMKLAGRSGPSMQTAAMIALCAALYVMLYRLLLPLALRVLEQRRELILRAVTRE
jgi:ABC-2 type transport system permease protein